jgi:hypothetical protein
MARQSPPGQPTRQQQGQQPGQDQDAAGALRDFKTRSRALPDDQRRDAFQSDEFRRLVADAAVPIPLPAATMCATHCLSHCGSHCYAHAADLGDTRTQDRR